MITKEPNNPSIELWALIVGFVLLIWGPAWLSAGYVIVVVLGALRHYDRRVTREADSR